MSAWRLVKLGSVELSMTMPVPESSDYDFPTFGKPLSIARPSKMTISIDGDPVITAEQGLKLHAGTGYELLAARGVSVVVEEAPVEVIPAVWTHDGCATCGDSPGHLIRDPDCNCTPMSSVNYSECPHGGIPCPDGRLVPWEDET